MVERGAGTCHPARITGCDYFDVLRLDGDAIAVCIGDVSGKGCIYERGFGGVQIGAAAPKVSPVFDEFTIFYIQSTKCEVETSAIVGVITHKTDAVQVHGCVERIDRPSPIVSDIAVLQGKVLKSERAEHELEKPEGLGGFLAD